MDRNQKENSLNLLKQILLARWLLIVGVTGSGILSILVRSKLDSVALTIPEVFYMAAGAAFYNVLYYFFIRKGINTPDKTLNIISKIQPFLDFFMIITIIYVAGGSFSYDFSYFFFPILVGGAVLSTIEVVGFTAVCVVAYDLLVVFEYYNLIPFSPYVGIGSSYYHSLSNVVSVAYATSFAIFATGILTALLNRAIGISRTAVTNERNRVSLIIENINNGVIFVDSANRFTLFNKAAGKLFNVVADDVIGRNVSDPPSNNYIKKVYEVVFGLGTKQSTESHRAGEYGVEIAGDSNKSQIFKIFNPEPITVRVTPIRVTKDNTPQEVADAADSRLENVEGTIFVVEDITREEAISQMKSEFISVAAHQLRTPLSAVKWTLKMLLEGDLGSITAEQKDFITKGYDTNEHMIRLVSDLLDVSRIEEGKFGYTFVMTSLDKLVSDLVNQSQLKAQEKQIILKYVPPTAPVPDIKIDPEKLAMAIQNLIENAIRYTLKGGSVTVSLSTNATNEIIAVQDTGVGIPQEQINRLFTKFFRADNVIRMQTEGSGLGLYITRNIVRRHGGDITVTSREGQGSTFAIALPLDVSRVPEKEQPSSEELFSSFITGF